MKQNGESIKEILNKLPEDRKESMESLFKVIEQNIPSGFEAGLSYGMIGFVVPHSIYPSGYHCKPSEPLPFISIASQKNFIAFYHMGIYAKPELLSWFEKEFPKHSSKKLDMGKSCIRFKKPEDIPLQLIGELCQKITHDEWIDMYESQFKK